jgi:rubrerythrin
MMRVAVQDERSGIRMYESLAKVAKSEGLAEAFLDLAEQEKGHEQRFQNILNDMPEEASFGSYPDEYVDYLETLVADGGQPLVAGRAANVESDREAIDLADQFERAQMALQRDIGQIVGGKFHDATEAILAEERSHLTRLSQLRKEYG